MGLTGRSRGSSSTLTPNSRWCRRSGGSRCSSASPVAAFADIWSRFPKGNPDSFFGAFYQSILELGANGWAGAGASRFLRELSADRPPRQLSIRFNIDGFDDDSTSPTFTLGRVVGAIGPYQPTEPKHFVAGRALQPVPQSPLNTAYLQIDGGVLELDVGNSLPTQSAGGPLVDLGRLYAAILPASGQPVLIGEIDYRGPDWYQHSSGIVAFRLDPARLSQAAQTPLGVIQSGATGFQPLLAEDSGGAWLRADSFVFRLNPGESAKTTFYATTFGRRASGRKISLGYDPSVMAGQTDQGPIPGPSVVGQPQSALTFPPSITTRPAGTADLTLTAADPGRPRDYIDGQVFGVIYAAGDNPPPLGSVQNGSQMLSALVFSVYQIPAEPTWLGDVRPIFQQYADLYPVMRPILHLDDFADVVSKRMILKSVFAAPINDPNSMPVTRDLSAAKRAMILAWLDRPVYMRLDSIDDMMTALQQAIELEHSTIPPYLCALYSLKTGANEHVARVIRSIVIQEMLHMALVSNLLISIGGAPRIGHPGFVPRYPGPLPGGLRAGLTVRLRRCSIAQIRDVFLSIEEPEETIESVDNEIDPSDPTQFHRYTIGWFYREIDRALADLNQKGQISFGHVDRQVSKWPMPGGLRVIASLDDACAAIREIKEQGEGASPLDPDDADRELSHYYKFAEIVAERRLVVTPGGFAFNGDRIPFDPDGVWPMVDDPDMALLPPGSRAAILAGQFARTYKALLNGLHRTFNGEPDYLSQAVGLMYSLDLAARQLMQTPSGLADGSTVGPSFQTRSPG
jgi:Ferritin-like